MSRMMIINNVNFLREVYDNSLVGIIVVDRNLRIAFVNKIVELFTGYSEDELQGMDVFRIAHPEDHEKIMDAYEKGLKGKPLFVELRYLTKDGKTRWVWGFIKPIEVENELFGFGNWVDITHTKELQSKLKESEEFYRTLMELSVAPVVIVQDGVITYVNRSFEEVLGYDRKEVLRENPFEFLIHPDDVPEMVEKYFNLLTRKSSVEEHQFRVFSKSGDVIWAWGRGSLTTIDGKPAVVVTAIDITKLKESDEFHRSLIDESLAPIHIVQEGKLVYLNQSFVNMLGYRKFELKEKTLASLIHPEDREEVLKKYMEVEHGLRNSEELSFRVVTKEGGYRWLTVRLSRITYYGKPAVASTAVDTTEIHNLTTQLKSKSEYLSLLNKILRHDILNDLTVVRAALELKDEKLMDVALTKIDRISKLIYETKALEKLGDVKKEINLADTVREVAETFKEIANVRLKLEDVSVLANEEIKTVIFNILNNAVKHSGKNPVDIEVETFSDGDWAVLRISDDGKGIPDEIKNKIFEEGFSAGYGTGIGLFLVKKVVEIYGGSVKVADNYPSGAVFEVRLPRVRESRV